MKAINSVSMEQVSISQLDSVFETLETDLYFKLIMEFLLETELSELSWDRTRMLLVII
jgi:hypothetical protein